VGRGRGDPTTLSTRDSKTTNEERETLGLGQENVALESKAKNTRTGGRWGPCRNGRHGNVIGVVIRMGGITLIKMQTLHLKS